MDAVRRGDFVYLDPPYVHTANHEHAYSGHTFGRREQEALAAWLPKLARKGATFLLSNRDTEETRELYAGFARVSVRVQHWLATSRKGKTIGQELLVTNNKTIRECLLPWPKEEKQQEQVCLALE